MASTQFSVVRFPTTSGPAPFHSTTGKVAHQLQRGDVVCSGSMRFRVHTVQVHPATGVVTVEGFRLVSSRPERKVYPAGQVVVIVKN